MSQLNHALRSQGITGSEIAKVAGVSRWGGPLEVWGRKLGLTPEPQVNADMARGNRLEPVLCDWAAEVVGLYPVDLGTLQSRRNPLVIASPDRLLYPNHGAVEMGQAVEALEVKSPRRTQHAWTHPEEDHTGIDPEYLPQVTWEMLAADVHRATVAALCYGELWVYRLTLDPELAGLLVTAAERFWHDHILTKTPPSPDRGADADVLRALHPQERAPLGTWPEGVSDSVITRWRELDAAAKVAEEQADRQRALVMAAVGDHAGVELPGAWRVTWKANKATRRTDWEAVARALDPPQAIVEQHTTERQGARVLRYTDLSQTKRRK